METSSVPLMMDIEGQDDNGGNKNQGLEAGLKGDFAYNNNVAGASKHVRLGKFLIKVRPRKFVYIYYIIHSLKIYIFSGPYFNCDI